MAETRTCGDCKLFKTSDCPSIDHFREYVDGRPLMDASCAACREFQPNPKAKKQKKILKDSGLSNNGCFEAIYHKDKPLFLIKNSDAFSIVESVEVNGETFHPKDVRHIPYEPYGWFEGEVPNREDLFWMVWREIDSFIDVEPIWKDLLAAIVLLSYHQEKLQTVPYLLLYGDNESGKSTVLGMLKFLCYRPMYGVTVPPADIYGFLEDSDSIGCVLEDEIQGIHKDTDKIKIYKAGYKQGAIVPRTILTNYDRIIKYYRTFCFKACACEHIPQVKGFLERFVPIPMVEGYPEKEWADITKEDLKRLCDLRNRLLKWRMLSRSWDLPSVELNVKGRLKELWKPILQITSGLTMYEGLFKFVENQRKESLSLKQDTLEGKIVKVVVDVLNESKEGAAIPFQTIWSLLQEELDGTIDEKKPNVMDTPEFFQVTKNKVGYRLREVLSGRSKTIREKLDGVKDEDCPRIKAYDFDKDKLRRIAKKYGYEFVTKLPSAPSSEGVKAPESMDKTGENKENNVEKDPHTPQELSELSYLVTSENELSEPSISSKNSREKSTVGERTSNSVTSDAGELVPLDGDWQDSCIHCGVSGQMKFQLNRPDGSWGLLCGSCGQKLSERLNKNE